MELIRGLHNIKSQHRGCVATIGNFDGIHLGHQQVIKKLCQRAKALQMPSLLITFEPYPKEFFLHDQAPARLTRLREKLHRSTCIAVDRVLVIRFNRNFSQMTAKDFVTDIIHDALDIKYLIVGDDFNFGQNREGDITLLRHFGTELGFHVESVGAMHYEKQRISSSRIRAALASGDLLLAEALLGRCYSMCGRVAHGDKRGRMIGFPTANVYLHRKTSPIQGVFAVKIHGLESNALYGVANVGNRPTFDGSRTLLEIHIFNFNEKIYGRYIQVDFFHKLRDEKRYDSFELLKEQIFKDAQSAREFFGIV